MKAVETPNDVHTCRGAITCLGDILHTVGAMDELSRDQKMQGFAPILASADALFASLFASLRDGDVERDIKPDLFTCCADFFWELPAECRQYVDAAVSLTIDATRYPVDQVHGEEGLEWLDKLFCAIVDVWDALVVAGRAVADPVSQNLPSIMQFLGHVNVWSNASRDLIKGCILFLRDAGVCFRDSFIQTVGEGVLFHRSCSRSPSSTDSSSAASTAATTAPPPPTSARRRSSRS